VGKRFPDGRLRASGFWVLGGAAGCFSRSTSHSATWRMPEPVRSPHLKRQHATAPPMCLLVTNALHHPRSMLIVSTRGTRLLWSPSKRKPNKVTGNSPLRSQGPAQTAAQARFVRRAVSTTRLPRCGRASGHFRVLLGSSSFSWIRGENTNDNRIAQRKLVDERSQECTGETALCKRSGRIEDKCIKWRRCLAGARSSDTSPRARAQAGVCVKPNLGRAPSSARVWGQLRVAVG